MEEHMLEINHEIEGDDCCNGSKPFRQIYLI